MVFPPDVQGMYRAPERDIGVHQGISELRSVVAEVTRDTIVFREIPQGEGSQDIEVYSKNTESTGYDPLKKGAQKAVVRVDGNKHYGHEHAPTPIVFTTTQYNKIFEFEYLIPLYDDQPWTFTKTTTPPDPQGMDSNLIMLAVVLMVAAAVAVSM